MARLRSPGYPSIPLDQAVELAEKLHVRNRTSPVAREAAAKDMGFSGLTGRSAKLLADLGHYGLVEKSSKGDVHVTKLAVDIIYPSTPENLRFALREAATRPELFSKLAAHFDGLPSRNALTAFLMRLNFASAAIPQAIDSFIGTYHYLQQENAIESHGTLESDRIESPSLDDNGPADTPQLPRNEIGATRQQPQGTVKLMEGERVVFVEEGNPSQYLKVVAAGKIDPGLLEALDDFVKRQRRRLNVQASTVRNAVLSAVQEEVGKPVDDPDQSALDVHDHKHDGEGE